ncbi:hypothetical protein Tco_0438219 [Tanacetum coccineum]
MPIAVPTSSPPLLLPSTSRREDKPEVTLPPRKRLGIALGPRYEVGESSSAAARLARGLRADYMFVATMDREIRRDPKREETGCDFRDAEGRPKEICKDERAEESWSYSIAAAYTDTDSDAVITGTGDHATGIGGSTAGVGYRTTGTAGTRWRSCTTRAARGGW